MPDIEKAIRILEGNYKSFVLRHKGELITVNELLALLKAQEPRLVTEADFENADGYGFLPVWVEEKDNSEIVCDCITRHAITDPDENYHYRYWTSRPTDEMMRRTPWKMK